jgi:hypothetical protein
MRKISTSMTLTESTTEFITHIAEINHISKSQATELLSEMVQDYFSDEQIRMELQVRGAIDGRRSKKPRDK